MKTSSEREGATWTYCGALLGLGNAQQLVSQQRLLQHSVVADADGDQRDVKDLAFEEGLQHHVHHACRQCRAQPQRNKQVTFHSSGKCIFNYISSPKFGTNLAQIFFLIFTTVYTADMSKIYENVKIKMLNNSTLGFL